MSPKQDVEFIELTDGILIANIRRHAASQGVTPSVLCQTALQNCDNLNLLSRIMNQNPLTPDDTFRG